MAVLFAAITVDEDPGDPGEQLEAVFFSDWASASTTEVLPNQTSANNRDGGKWDTLTGITNGFVIPAPEGFPTLNAYQVAGDYANRDGASILQKNGLGDIAVPGTRNYRWYFRLDEPSYSTDHGQHPIQDGGAVSVSNWYLGTTNGGSNLGDGEWGIDWVFGGAVNFNDSKWALGTSADGDYTPLSKASVYRFEIQIVRESMTSFRAYTWVHDAASEATLYTAADFRNRAGQSGFTSVVHAFQNLTSIETLIAGHNGMSDESTSGTSMDHPWLGSQLTLNTQTGFAVVDGLGEGRNIGPYGRVSGETPP